MFCRRSAPLCLVEWAEHEGSELLPPPRTCLKGLNTNTSGLAHNSSMIMLCCPPISKFQEMLIQSFIDFKLSQFKILHILLLWSTFVSFVCYKGSRAYNCVGLVNAFRLTFVTPLRVDFATTDSAFFLMVEAWIY